MIELPLTLRVDETDVLPQVATVDEVRDATLSCFAELLPHSAAPVEILFPDSESHQGGEVPPPAWWFDSRAHLSDLHLFKVCDALVLPASGVVVSDSGDVMRRTMEEAAYASADLTHLPCVARRDGRLILDIPDDARRVAKAVVSLPHGAIRNYGHFLLDGMASLAAITSTGAFAEHAVLTPPLQSWQARHFALFGAVPAVTQAHVVRVGEVVYTSAMNHFLHAPNFNYRSLRDRQLARLGPSARGSGGRRLYLSRRGGSPRTMLSERRLVARLRGAGFEIVDPAGMSVDRQIELFDAAEAVVGVTGAAFANALYCRPGTLVVEIQPLGMENHWVLPLCQIMGLRHAAYFCATRAPDPLRPERSLTFDLDVDRLLDFIFAFPPLDRTRRRGSLLRRLGHLLPFSA